MTPIILFSKQDGKIGTKAITFGSSHLTPEIDDIPAHTAVKIGNYVYEAVMFGGVRIRPYNDWVKQNRLVACVAYDRVPFEQDRFDRNFSDLWKKKYDFMAILYFAVYLLLNKYIGIKLPKVNKWHNENRYFCVELISLITGDDYEMTPPNVLLRKMKHEILDFH
jgi:hypothetical protein